MEAQLPHGTPCMMNLIISALQVRLYRLQLRVGNRWDGGSPKHSPPVFFSTRSPIQNHIALLMMPAASGWSSTATSRLLSWNGSTPRLAPPVALALQVCDRESLRNGCLLHVLWLSIPCLQIISDRINCLEIAALPIRFTSSNNCFDGCEAQRHCILSSTDYLTACCICTLVMMGPSMRAVHDLPQALVVVHGHSHAHQTLRLSSCTGTPMRTRHCRIFISCFEVLRHVLVTFWVISCRISSSESSHTVLSS